MPRAVKAFRDRSTDLDRCDLPIEVTRCEALLQYLHTVYPRAIQIVLLTLNRPGLQPVCSAADASSSLQSSDCRATVGAAFHVT